MRRLSIVVSNYTLEKNGLSTWCLRWAEGFKRYGFGHVSLLVYRRAPGDQMERAREHSLDVACLGRRQPFAAIDRLRLARFVRLCRPDVFVATSLIDLQAVDRFPPETKVWYHINSKAACHRQRYLMWRGSRVQWFACSASLKTDFSSEPPVYVAPYWVNVHSSGPVSFKTPLRLIYAGRLEQYIKRVFDLVSICRILKEQGLDFILDIAGWGTQAPALQRVFLGEGFSDRVRFHGPYFYDEAPALLSGHHIILHCSESEGSPWTILEALGQGLVPVVAQAQGGLLEIVQHEKTGLTFPVGDAQAAAQCVLRLGRCPDFFERLSHSCWQGAAAYDEKVSLKKLYDLFIGQAPRPESATPWPRPETSAPGAPEALIRPQQLPESRISPVAMCKAPG